MDNYPFDMSTVEFGIRGYGYGYNKVSTNIFLRVWIFSINIRYQMDIWHVGHPDLIYYLKFSFFQFLSMTCCLVLKLSFDAVGMIIIFEM
jgi:hypothetical protein